MRCFLVDSRVLAEAYRFSFQINPNFDWGIPTVISQMAEFTWKFVLRFRRIFRKNFHRIDKEMGGKKRLEIMNNIETVEMKRKP